ncbi:hypothetical protein BT69DRAFT_1335756 [Atractiella rhizophila]|nr:hypothetical protein BT69DRAFT_1335756 [Atractiella rhizophila]
MALVFYVSAFSSPQSIAPILANGGTFSINFSCSNIARKFLLDQCNTLNFSFAQHLAGTHNDSSVTKVDISRPQSRLLYWNHSISTWFICSDKQPNAAAVTSSIFHLNPFTQNILTLGSNEDSSESSLASIPHRADVGIHVYQHWEDDPFQQLPVELVLAVLTPLLTPPSQDNADNLQQIQTFRLVCRRFASIALQALFQEIGSLVARGRRYVTWKHVNVLKVLKNYGHQFLPWIKKLHLRRNDFQQATGMWNITLTVSRRCQNLRSLVLELRPPSNPNRRQIIFDAIAEIQSLELLNLVNRKDHGSSRWRFADLTYLFQRKRIARFLKEFHMHGCDFLDFDEVDGKENVAANLEDLNLESCKIPSAFFEWSTRLSHTTFGLNSFWPTPNYECHSISKMMTTLHDVLTHLRIEHSPMTEDMSLYGEARFSDSLDEAIHGCRYAAKFEIFTANMSPRNLEWLYLDGGSHSNLVSSGFLDNLACHKLHTIHLFACDTTLEQITKWSNKRLNRGSQRIRVAWTELFGDPEIDGLIENLERENSDMEIKGTSYTETVWMFELRNMSLYYYSEPTDMNIFRW